MKFDFKCNECKTIFPSDKEEKFCIHCNSEKIFKYFGNANLSVGNEKMDSGIEARLYAHKKYLQDQIKDMTERKEEFI